MLLFNTLTRTKEALGSDKNISMYTCGLTVYSHPHIGNWSAYIYWDVLHRTLIQAGYKVKRIQNITDVGHLVSDGDDGEDKLEQSARAEQTTAWHVASKYIGIATQESNRLNLLQPEYVRATDTIEEQMKMVEQLTDRGVTYELADGIYFDTAQFPSYAELAKLDIKGLRSGARVEDTGKRNPTDFAVWKFSPQGTTRDMEWEYPKGSGRMGFPGWHLECSAIARYCLGDQIDIHTGGIDHIPVHHSNEIAQTETLTCKQFSRFWLHNNHLMINEEKLAKSAGNGILLSHIEERGHSLEVFKLFVLTSHYRTQGNFSWDIIKKTADRYKRWEQVLSQTVHPITTTTPDSQEQEAFNTMIDTMEAAMQDDLDTPQVISVIDTYIDELEKASKQGFDLSGQKRNLKVFIGSYLGIEIAPLLIIDFRGMLTGDGRTLQTALDERSEARASSNWELSDTLRDEIHAHGLIVKDVGNLQLVSFSRTE